VRPLREQRLLAAESSGGISSEPIYQLARSLIRKLDLHGDFLDFGPGIGLFIQQLLKLPWSGTITCADLYPRPAELPDTVRWLQADLNDPLPLPDHSFDCILCMEVIAHLENPRFVFREFSRLLRPGGMLLLTMPNQESLRSISGLFGGGHFSHFRGAGYPARITALVRLDLDHICSETGFTPPEFHYTDSGLVPKLHLSWQKLSFGLLKGCAFSDNLAMVTRKI
jgi:2-polyprenyl-3-methyl-5-hydroxy-6-metoxy-1,4-benzoquinol methylase